MPSPCSSPSARARRSAPSIRRRPAGATRCCSGGEPRDLQLLNELGVLSDALRLQLTVPARLVQRRCCLVAFLRGVFLGCGTVSAPGAPVHLELTVEDVDLARQLQGLLARLDLDFHLAERDRNVACYTKRSETASALLAVLGAHDACLRWEEHAVMGEMRGRANRLANCDEANARRAASAGERQADAARRLMAAPAWGTLPGSVREAAELRLEYPYLSLSELAARARAAAQPVGPEPPPAAAGRAGRRAGG